MVVLGRLVDVGTFVVVGRFVVEITERRQNSLRTMITTTITILTISKLLISFPAPFLEDIDLQTNQTFNLYIY